MACRHWPVEEVHYLPLVWEGALKAMPFAVGLFLAIEQVPLAAEKSIRSKRIKAQGGDTTGIITLLFGLFNPLANASIPLGLLPLSQSEPLIDGFKVLSGDNNQNFAGHWSPLLLASFHTIIFASGGKDLSLSSRLFPVILSYP